MFDTILFDLDGTLIDSAEGITRSVAYAAEKMGVPVPSPSELRAFIGPPLIDSFVERMGFDRTRAEQAVLFYRERFASKGIYESSLYDGIPEMLGRLAAAGKTLMIATSKPEVYAKDILSDLGLANMFAFIGGSLLDNTRTGKGEVIAHVLRENNLSSNPGILMVGDRLHDIAGAKENRLASMGVLYGFGDLPELTQAGADYIANSPEDVADKILALKA